MKVFKKFGTFTMVLILMFVSINMTTFAASVDEEYSAVAIACDEKFPINTNDTADYFCFSNTNSRMDATGSFTFSFMRIMDSDSFKPATSQISLVQGKYHLFNKLK